MVANIRKKGVTLVVGIDLSCVCVGINVPHSVVETFILKQM